LGLGRISKANKGMQQLTASDAMERHRNRMKEKEALAEKARAVEAKIRSRKQEIRTMAESNEKMRTELERQAQWRDMLGN
jgi:hypothetical protein